MTMLDDRTGTLARAKMQLLSIIDDMEAVYDEQAADLPMVDAMDSPLWSSWGDALYLAGRLAHRLDLTADLDAEQVTR